VELTPELLYGLLLAEIAGQRGDLQDAAAFYLEAAKMTRDPRVAERATRIALFARDKGRALASARLWAELDPENMEAQQALVLLLLNEGQQEAALEHLEKLTSAQGAPTPERFMEIAALLGRVQDKQAALQLMERFVARYRELPEALLAYASVALHAGEAQRAMELVDQALARRLDWPEAVVFRARLLYQQEKTDEALDYLRGVVEHHPQERTLRLSYARLLVDAHRFNEAITQFESLAEVAPEDEEVAFALGLLSLQTDRLDDAQRYLTRLVQAGKRVPEASYFLGQVAEAKKQFDEAEAWYSRVEGGEYYFDSRIRLAAVAARRGNVKDALLQLEALQVQDAEEAVRVYLAQAEILAGAEQLQQALSVYNGALEKFPDHTDLLYARALLAERMDRVAQAEEDLKRILAKEPSNAQALNALGYTLVDRTDPRTLISWIAWVGCSTSWGTTRRRWATYGTPLSCSGTPRWPPTWERSCGRPETGKGRVGCGSGR
jgi:tetratricopeptide (TPR) repeat protein